MNETYEKYYLNRLSENDKKAFEEQLSSDPILSEDYRAYVLIQDHLKSSTRINSALTILDEVHNTKAPTKVRSLLSQRVTVAATIILVAAAIFLMRPKSASSNQEIFAQHFSPAEISLVTKGDNQNEVLAKISQLYNEKNYSQTVAYYRQEKNSLANNPRVDLMIGNAYLEIAQYELAKEQLELLVDQPTFKTEYLWYKGLAYLADEEDETAKKLFDKIPQSSNYYSKAREVLILLNNSKSAD